jgi:hypothetical protein
MRRDTGSRAARPDGYTRRGDVSPVPPGLAPRTPGQWQGGVRACVGVVSAASAWQACHTTAIPDAGTATHTQRPHPTPRQFPSCHWRGWGVLGGGIRSRVEGDKRTGIVGPGRWSVGARRVEWRAGQGEGLPSGAGNSCTDSRPTSGQHSVEGAVRAAVAQGAVERDGCTIKTGSRWSSFSGALQVTLANR